MFKWLLRLCSFITFIIISCDRVDIPSLPQHRIPTYTQMLLKGDVEEVIDSMYCNGKLTNWSSYKFDKNHNVIDGERDGGLRLTDPSSLTVTPYHEGGYSYAFFICPETWKEKSDTTIIFTYKEKSIKKEYHWNNEGFFTEVRCYFDGQPFLFEGKDNLAEFFYHENGYPKYWFGVNSEGFQMEGKFDFTDFDDRGNPLKIKFKRYINIPGRDGEYEYRRTIKYR